MCHVEVQIRFLFTTLMLCRWDYVSDSLFAVISDCCDVSGHIVGFRMQSLVIAFSIKLPADDPLETGS
jgi:hypothetical protein